MLVGENVCRSCFAVLVTSYDSVIIYFDLFALAVPIYLSIYQTNGSLLYALQNKERLSEDEGYKRVFDDDNEERALKEPKRKVKYSVCCSYSNHWEFFVSYLFNAIRCFCWFAVLLFHLVVLCCLLVT